MTNIVRIDDVEPKEVPLKEGHHGGQIWWIFGERSKIRTEGVVAHIQEYPPGGFTGEEHGAHSGVEQIYYVISGTMAVHIAGEDLVAGAGSLVYIPRGAKHYHRNSGKDNLVFLTVNCPVRSGEVPPLRGSP